MEKNSVVFRFCSTISTRITEKLFPFRTWLRRYILAGKAAAVFLKK